MPRKRRLSPRRPRPRVRALTRRIAALTQGNNMHYLLAVAVLVCNAALAFAADPVGRYLVSGTNPGDGSPYSGTVQVARTGDTYQVVWAIGNERYVGTGIGNHEGLAVSYRSGNATGLALYGAEDGNWQGVWAYAGSRQLGTEVWKRR